MTPIPGRRLIVNADDFGLSVGVNAGIAEAFDGGIVTSASLMVRGSAARDAAHRALERPALGVGRSPGVRLRGRSRCRSRG